MSPYYARLNRHGLTKDSDCAWSWTGHGHGQVAVMVNSWIGHGRGLTKFAGVAWTPCGLNRDYGVDISGTHPSYCWATAWKLLGCYREVARRLRGYYPDAARQLTGSCSDDLTDVAWMNSGNNSGIAGG
jgi:hypothetical protein